MSNRFDEMVEAAVSEVEMPAPAPRPKPERKTAKPKNKNEKVVSLDIQGEATKERAKRNVAREPKRVGDNDAAATLARSLTRPLVTKTVRFRPELAEALNRIVLENKLAGRKPDTIQDVVNEAAEAWVNNHMS